MLRGEERIRQPIKLPYLWLMDPRTWVQRCVPIRYFSFNAGILVDIRTQRPPIQGTKHRRGIPATVVDEVVVLDNSAALERIEARVSDSPPRMWWQA